MSARRRARGLAVVGEVGARRQVGVEVVVVVGL